MLKKGSKRATAQPFLVGLAASGLASNKALAQLKEAGLGYRRSDFLRDYRLARGFEQQKDRAKYIRKDFYPTASVITPTVLNLQKKFHHYVTYNAVDNASAETYGKELIVASDTPLTVRQIESDARECLEINASEYNQTVKGIIYVGTKERID